MGKRELIHRTASRSQFNAVCFFRTAVLFFVLFGSVSASESVAVVVPESLRQALAPWGEYRRSQGYEIHILSLPSGSPATAVQIKERLRSLAEQVPLSAVLLVGNGTVRQSDAQGGQPSEISADQVVPAPRFASRMIQHFGKEEHFASDDWYADLNDDGIVDFPIGRFPVQSPEELTLMIQKTLRYETQIKPGMWCRRIQLVAGLGNFSPVLDGVIELAARYILTQTVPHSYEFALLHADWKSPFCPYPLDYPAALTETINRGSLFWCYIGHGNHRELDPLSTPKGKIPVLNGERFPTLQCRDAPPIVLLLCCYGGTLDFSAASLAESFVLQENGAVASIAASRTTMPYGMSILGLEMLHELFHEERRHSETRRFTLGQLVWAAKRRVLFPPEEETKKDGKAAMRPVREMVDKLALQFDPMPEQLAVQREEQIALFHLFGDPLLGLPVPQTISLTVPSRVRAGQTFSVTGTVPKDRQPIKTVRLELVPASGRISLRTQQREEFRLDAETQKRNNDEYRQANEQAVFTCDVPVSGNSFSAEVPVPKDIFGAYVLRAFGTAPRSYALGSADITIRLRRNSP